MEEAGDYFEVKKIHYILESIVGALVRDKPSDPLEYLSEMLTRMQHEEDNPSVEITDLGSGDALESLRRMFLRKAKDGALTREAFIDVLKDCVEDHDNQQEQILQLHTIFNVFDRDHSGSVDIDEFNAGIRILFRGTEEDKMDFAFSGLDYNHDGDVTVSEFLKFFRNYFTAKCALNGTKLVKSRWSAIEDHLSRVFRASDANSNGTIDTAEFRAAVKRDPDHPFTLVWQSFQITPAPQNGTKGPQPSHHRN